MALERFIPKSPDIFIRNSQDFEVAKFGHLNTIVEYINNNSAKPAGLNGYVQFNDNSALGGDAGLFWDNINKRLGIGTVTPVNLLSIDATNSTLPTEHSAAAATIKSGVQSPLRVLRTGGQPNVWIGTSSTTPNVSSFLFGIRTGAYYNTATPTYSGDYAPWIVSRGNDWGTATSASDLRMSQIFTCDGNTARAALAIYPALVETATNTDIVNMNNLLIATRNSFSTQPLARLQIIGDGQTSGTTSLLVQNSTGTTSLRVYDDRVVEVPYRIHTPFIRNEYANLVLYSGSFEVEIQSSNPTNASGSLRTTGEITTTDNQTKSIINVNNLVPSTSAAFNTLNGFAFTSTITQTTGTIRGLFINPTLNASTDFRAIETVRGNVLLATTSGNVGIGTTNPSSALVIARNGGILRIISTSDSSSSLIIGNDNSNSRLSLDGGESNNGSIAGITANSGVRMRMRGSYLTIATSNVDPNNTPSLFGIRGVGSTSATTSLLVQNSAGTQLGSVNDAGQWMLGAGTPAFQLDVANDIRARGGLYFGAAGSYLYGDTNNIRLYDKNNSVILQAYPSGVINSETALASSSGNKFIKVNDNAISLEWFNGNASNSVQNPVKIVRGFFGNVIATDKTVLNITTPFFSNLTNATTLRGIFIDINDTTTYTGFTTVRAIEAPRGGAYFNTTTPQASAVLQADSTTQGFLPPRMTTAQRVAIASPVNGLIVFDTDVQNLCYRRDGVWVQATFAAV
jgi:hypothetical protein